MVPEKQKRNDLRLPVLSTKTNYYLRLDKGRLFICLIALGSTFFFLQKELIILHNMQIRQDIQDILRKLFLQAEKIHDKE